MSDNVTLKQELVIKDGKTLTLDGVVSVDSLSEDYLCVQTIAGSISVEGENLKIDSLTKEDGKIKVLGKITGVFYKDTPVKQGMFKKLFG